MSLINFKSPIIDQEGQQTRSINMSVTDSLATVVGSGYLNKLVDVNGNPVLSAVNGVYINQYSAGGNGLQINNGDFLFIAYSGGQGIFQVSASGTTITLANPFISELYTQVSMTLAQFQGMYTTPYLILAAQGANIIALPRMVIIKQIYGSAALVGGGAVSAQWGNTAHAGGVLATVTEQATDFTGATASTIYRLGAATGNGTQGLSSAIANAGVYLSNDTAVWTVGTASTFLVGMYYNLVSSNS